MPGQDNPATDALRDWKQGGAAGAGRLIERLYPELRRLAAQLLKSERPDHTLQPTALIHELYLRLALADIPELRDRAHFLAIAANTLRHILIDYARARRTERRGGKQVKIPVDGIEVGVACSYDDLLIIDEALNQLHGAEPRAAQVAELRFFAGLELSEIAGELGVSETTVGRDWKFARAWLASRLSPGKRE